MHHGMDRMIAHRDAQGDRDPLLDGAIAGKPIGFREAGLELASWSGVRAGTLPRGT